VDQVADVNIQGRKYGNALQAARRQDNRDKVDHLDVLNSFVTSYWCSIILFGLIAPMLHRAMEGFWWFLENDYCCLCSVLYSV
jgi:hypothetical protein